MTITDSEGHRMRSTCDGAILPTGDRLGRPRHPSSREAVLDRDPVPRAGRRGESLTARGPWWVGFIGSSSGYECGRPVPMGVHVPLQRPLACDDADFRSEAER